MKRFTIRALGFTPVSALALFALTTACDPATPRIQVDQQGQGQTGNVGAPDLTHAVPAAPVHMQFSRDMFMKANLDTNQLSYQFSYLNVQKSDKLTFTNGTASLNISGLSAGVAGDMTLVILQANAPQYKGVLANITLKPTNNVVNMQLQPVNTVPGQTSVTINTSFGDDSVTPVPTPVGTPNLQPTPTVFGTPAAVSFSRDVKPIFDRSCSECHTSGGRLVDLTQYPSQANVISDILNRVQAGSMPPAPRTKLSQSEISLIQQWQASGANP